MNVVLIEPEIPWNTGNIGRSCVATGSALHLVGRLGFSLEEKEIRRSGLDYWPRLKLFRHASLEHFLESLPADADLHFFSTKAERSIWETRFTAESYLVFGKESTGLPESARRRFADRLVKIPFLEGQVRSLNLSTSAGVALYEALRSTGWKPETAGAAR